MLPAVYLFTHFLPQSLSPSIGSHSDRWTLNKITDLSHNWFRLILHTVFFQVALRLPLCPGWSYAWDYSVQGGRRFGAGERESLWLNSGLLSDCFSCDWWKLAQLGTDIHSPIQSIERWLPLGHKSQLLLRHTAIGPSEGHFRSKWACVLVRREKEWMRGCVGRFHKWHCARTMAKGTPKLLDMANRLSFTIKSCREGQRTIPYYEFMWLVGDIILGMWTTQA